MTTTLLAFRRAAIPLAFLLLSVAPAMAQSDTLAAQVIAYPAPGNVMLSGPTPDLALLDVRTFTIKSAIMLSGKPDSADQLLIIREGDLNLTIGDSTNGLGPGSIALIPAGITYNLEAKLSTYYRFRFRSHHQPEATAAAKSPFTLTWANMPVQHTAKGETRQILSRPTTWLSKIDLHATTLNPGEVSHPPHTHRAEEIILLRTGNVRMYINGQHYPATSGGLVYLPSGSSHALENHSTERAEYFALQWLP